MPTSVEILAGLTSIANDWISVALAWHVAVAAALIAFAVGWRPGPRTAGLAIAVLPLSVAGFAFGYGNPFNGAVFTVLAIALVVFAVRDRRTAPAPQSVWTSWGAGLVIAYAWFYPHFLESPPQYLYAAPVGLVPCPTLAMAIGLALLTRGHGSRAWSMTLAGAATFYALFGVLRLGVVLDLGLLLGAVLLGIAALRPATSRSDALALAHG